MLKFPLRVPFPVARRTYATRRAERPPPKIRDPLLSPNATHQQLTPDLTFIHRPPPTAPTPFSLTTAPSSPLLLPHSSSPAAQAPDASTSSTPGRLPPPIRRPRPQAETKLSEEQIAEMKRLRLADPLTHTRHKLAKQFGCSPFFVPIAAPLSKTEMRKAIARKEHEHEALRKHWGERKKMVVAIRKKRRTLW